MPPTIDFQTGMIMIFAMILLYLFVGTAKNHYDIAFGHQAAVVAGLGFGISTLLQLNQGEGLQNVVEFNDNLFFYFCLPPLVFSSGYNMQRKKFFENFTNIMLFGVFGTITTFLIFGGLSLWLLSASKKAGEEDPENYLLWQVSGATGETTPLLLSEMECLLMCALLCSTDVIAAISMVNYDEQPKLYSLLFGEGVVNDAVAIILFNSVKKFADQPINAGTTFQILGDFIMLSIFSLLIGAGYGILSTCMLKWFRALARDAVNECILLFSFGYMCYVTAESLSQSGIIALLTCGVTMAHYAWYNLSPQGRQGSALIFQFMGNAVQGFIFAYLGLTFFAYSNFQWSSSLFGYELIIVIIGRFGGTLGLIKSLELCCKYKSGVRW